ncbi:MAG: glycosyltransferase [Candidatus Nanopelagicaceae bacterium]|nr:glycosyltransferase [Candidatus Nanopelagicaceae bacterium]
MSTPEGLLAPEPDKTYPDLTVTAILVTHDGARWLPEVVAAISSQTRPANQVVVADTGSLDSSRQLITNSGLPLIELERERGFGEAVAIAVETLPEIGSKSGGDCGDGSDEWLWLLHDDCAPAPGALAALLEAVSQRPQVGIAGPKICGWKDRGHLLEVGISIGVNGARWTGLEPRERDQGQHDGIRNVLSVSTAGALIRRDLFEELGGFDQHLTLFRDDIDLGWRAHVAGYSVICVTDSVVYHAEAAATERREVDVEGAPLHRPHLLDRRHAAYVLLVNAPRWILPWISLRLLFTAILRATGYLLAKLPGYALDEIAAIALNFSRLDILRKARKRRKLTRLLPSRVVRPFLAPWRDQVIIPLENLRDLVLRRTDSTPTTVITEPINDDADLVDSESQPKSLRLLIRPLPILLISLTFISLIAGRNRLGEISGGTLLQMPTSASELMRIYSDSWHAVALGTNTPALPILPLLSFLSLITFGNVSLLVTIIFLFGPVLAAASFFAFLRDRNLSKGNSALGALLFALNPLMITSISTGRIGTLLFIIFLPLCAISARQIHNPENLRWRRIAFLSGLFALLVSFSPPFFIIGLGSMIFLILNSKWRSNIFYERLQKFGVVTFASIGALAPWSTNALMHPTKWLMESGISNEVGQPWQVLIGNPGGIGSPPIFILGIVALVGLIALRSSHAVLLGGFTLLSTSFSAILMAIAIHANGDSLQARVWPGAFLVLANFFGIFALTTMLNGLVYRLQNSNFGYRHISTVILSTVAIYSTLALSVWWILPGADSPTRAGNLQIIPPFVAAATAGEERSRTLILQSQQTDLGTSVSYALLRERDLYFGEMDLMYKEEPVISKIVSEIVDGAGEQPTEQLANYGVRYIFLNEPVDKEVARKIDGVGGLVRLSATKDGVLWKIAGNSARVKFISADAEPIALASNRISANFKIPKAGEVLLAERFSDGWRLVVDGQFVKAEKTGEGLTKFKVEAPGDALLIHDGPLQRAGISLQLLTIGLIIFFALPRGRKRSELSDIELAR